MKSAQWHFRDDEECLRIDVPSGKERLIEILLRGDAAAMLSGTLCMLAIVDHKGREEMFFCDFRKLRVLARGHGIEPLLSADSIASGKVVAFGFRKGSGKDILWLGERAWQDTKILFGALPASTSPTSLPPIAADGRRPPALTPRAAGVAIAGLLLVSVTFVGITSYRFHGNAAPPVSEKHIGENSVLIVPAGSEHPRTMADPPPDFSESAADEHRPSQKKRKMKRAVQNDLETERTAPVLTLPCTRDMVDRGIPCG